MSTPRLSLSAFCQVVAQVVAGLPPEFQERLQNLAIDVEARPSRKLLDELGHDPHQDLMGVFIGRGLPDQEFGEYPPNRIVLFQRPIEQACRSRDEIAYEIRRTLLHELAHHFGFEEEDLDDFESQPSPFDEP